MKRALVSVGVVLALVAVTVSFYLWRSWAALAAPYKGYSGPRLELVVEDGLNARQILELLESEGVIESAFWARAHLAYELDRPTLKAGEYAFEGPASTREILDQLIRGEVVTHDITLIEGLDMFEVAAHLGASGFGREEVFLGLVQAPDLIADFDPEATDLEGYLFPDTYSFARGTTEAEIVETLVETFLRLYETQIQPLLGPEAPLSGRGLVTLASIVEKETSLDEERPVVAGVYSNRLRRGMGLFADPTVIYGLKLEGAWDGNIRRRDLESDSPYNTYRVAGLPPGPICSPGLASLRAAAAPADVPYLYFVSRNDGSHVFSRTLAEHNRNVEIWQRQYWRERWARERAEQTDSD